MRENEEFLNRKQLSYFILQEIPFYKKFQTYFPIINIQYAIVYKAVVYYMHVQYFSPKFDH